MIVAVNDRGLEWNALLRRDFAIVVHSQTLAVCTIDGERPTLRIEHTSALEAAQPFVPGDGREVRHETVENSPPRARRQMNRRGGHPVARWWLAHRRMPGRFD